MKNHIENPLNGVYENLEKSGKFCSLSSFCDSFVTNQIQRQAALYMQTGECEVVDADPQFIKKVLHDLFFDKDVESNTKTYNHMVKLGMEYKYPDCCIRQFARMSSKGVPPALYYALIGRKELIELDYTPCDTCYNFHKNKSVV